MSSDSSAPAAFLVKDCALIAIATGKRALTLRELRDMLSEVDAATIYFHFWGALLQPRFEQREYGNDFAAWARHGLHDAVLAERLGMLDPTDFADLEALREGLVDTIEERLEGSEYLPWLRATRSFEFIRSQIVVFDSHKRAQSPEELGRLVRSLSTGSIFYHFVDARRRIPDRHDDFTAWLASFGDRCSVLCTRLSGIDPYFGSLTELREQILAAFADSLAGAGP